MEFKILIETILAKLGLTQRDMAYYCGCAPASMNRYLNKKRMMPLDVFMSIAMFINADPRELYEIYMKGGFEDE